ncbi:MAG: uroporphyrinogen-III synthase [Hoeflea sp.]|uniref:uroporphyrinogen-III synthase n=1 Tax=Hoeflea sp. TaxID=1940281 RepID=UPI0032EE3F64
MLVTRPEPGGRRTALRLAEMGHEPVRLPLFEPRITAQAADLPEAGPIDALVATSARAFDFLRGAPIPRPYRRIPIHAVGPATAHSASEAGFATIQEAGGTALELARSLIANSSAGGEGQPARLLYLAGRPRKSSLEAELGRAGMSVTTLETYEMIEISYSTDFIMDDVFDPAPDVILLYSANAADRLVQLLSDKNRGKSLRSARFLCLSSDIRDRLPDPWRARATASARPEEDSLLASLAALG